MSEPTPPPKTEEGQLATVPVSESETPTRVTIDDLPFWLQHEVQTQKPIGERNNHCIKIAPDLMRYGFTPSDTLAALQTLYPNARQGELEGVVQRAEIYAHQQRTNDPEWAEKAARKDSLREEARNDIPSILEKYPEFEVDPPDWGLDEQRREFLKRMFEPDDVLWIGEVTQSGPRFKHHFRAMRTWISCRCPIVGEFTTHSTFKPGSSSRNYESIAERRYMVLESDILPSSELAAVAQYIRDFHELTMRAVVTTGGTRCAPEPGLHFWFDYPGDEVIDDWAAILQGYGADISTLRGPQPVRLPGCIRKSTGLKQEILWIHT